MGLHMKASMNNIIGISTFLLLIFIKRSHEFDTSVITENMSSPFKNETVSDKRIKNPFIKLKKPWKKTKSDSKMDSDQMDFDKIKKTSVFWKAFGLRKHECTKLIIEYIRDMKKIWNSYE